MDRILELLAKIDQLSPEELTELDGLVNEVFDDLASKPDDELTADDAANLEQLVEARQTVDTETATREQVRQDTIAKRNDLKTKMDEARKPKAETKPDEKGEGGDVVEMKPEGEDDKDKKGEGEGGKGPIGELVPEQVAAGADDTVQTAAELAAGAGAAGGTVTASAPRGTTQSHIARMAAEHGLADASSAGNEMLATPYRATIAAAAGLGMVESGSDLGSPEALGRLMSETLRRMIPDGSNVRNKRLVASAHWEYPEDRQLGDDAGTNTRLIEAVCRPGAARYDRRTGGLTASGGICAPVNVDYTVPTWSSADRPLRDALPAFQATRGGITYVPPPDIGIPDLQGGTASGAGLATRVWSPGVDADPAGQTKPVWQVQCGTPETIEVNAIPTRVGFGNMQSRFAPEQVAANTEQAIATAAREAELELLATIASATVQIKPQQYLGAFRDILSTVDRLKAGYKYTHRYSDNVGYTAIFPEWAKDLIRADMTRELAHDNAGSINVMQITDAQIESYFSARGIEIIWTLEGLQAGTYGLGGSAITNQYFTKPNTITAAEPQWPGQTSDGSFMLVWFMFVTGTFQFLDGGRLDLGVVRDSLLDATNDYETFVETFESVAFRGNEAYQVQQTILPSGGSAGSIAPSGYHE